MENVTREWASPDTTRVKKLTTPNRRRDGREVPNSVVEQKYKKNGKFQLVSQWVFSMSFKITKVKLLFLGWFYVLFVHLLRKWRIPNFPRSSGGKHDKNDKKKITFSVHIVTGISRGVWGGTGGRVGGVISLCDTSPTYMQSTRLEQSFRLVYGSDSCTVHLFPRICT